MSPEDFKPEDFKQVILKSIIDINGLIGFYKDENDDNWGTDPKNPCIADLFYKFFSSDCFFTGTTGNIPVWEQSCELTWYMYGYGLLGEPEELEGDNVIILEKLKKGDSKKWEDIFDLKNGLKYIKVYDKLIIYESDQVIGGFKIRTQPQPRPHRTLLPIKTKYINLSYTINFVFKDPNDKNNTKRYGRIDPFISVRSDDPIPQP